MATFCVQETLCVNKCGTAITLPSEYYLPCDEKRLKYGSAGFIFFPCNVRWNINSQESFDATVKNGSIGVVPRGTLIQGAPTFTEIETDGCGTKEICDIKIPYTFTTYNVDCGGFHTDYWKEFASNIQNFRMMPIDCNGLWAINDAWIPYVDAFAAGEPISGPDASPGFKMNITSPPQEIEGEGGKVQISIGFEIEPPNLMLCKRLLEVQAC